MKFRHLEYFVAAAEDLNFTHAAFTAVRGSRAREGIDTHSQ